MEAGSLAQKEVTRKRKTGTTTKSSTTRSKKPPAAPMPATPPDGVDEPSWRIAVQAAESKKATDIKVLDLTGMTSFTDFFVVCTGANPRQMQAIAEEVGLQLKKNGELPISVE